MKLNSKAMACISTAIASLAIYGGASLTAFGQSDIVQPAATAAAVVNTAASGTFEKSSFRINGVWQIIEENGQTIFRVSEDFKTKNGPDLKLFLSRKSVDDVTGKTATEDTVRLGVLRSNKGSQDYIIPADVDLSQFHSILILCEAYSKLWGGANI